MTRAVRFLLDHLNQALVGLSNPTIVVLASVLGIGFVLLVSVLIGVRRASRGEGEDEERLDIGPRFGRALVAYIVCSGGVAALCGAALRAAGGLAACGSVPPPGAFTPAVRFVTSDLYPWRDLCAAPLGTMAPAPTVGVPVGALESVSLLVGVFPLVAAAGFWWLASRLDGPELPFGERLLRAWGHRTLTKETPSGSSRREQQASDWFKATGWTLTLLGTGLLVAVGSSVPLLAAPGGTLFPACSWSSALGALILYLGLLLARGDRTEKPSKPATPPKATFAKGRKDWEAFVSGRGFVLHKGPGLQPVPLSNPNCDYSILRPRDAEPMRKSFQYLGPVVVDAVEHPLWEHQRVFVENLRYFVKNNRLPTNDPFAVLLHTVGGSGRTTALFEAAAATSLGANRRSLLLYPSLAAARKAKRLLDQQLNRSTQPHDALSPKLLHGGVAPEAGTRVGIATVDWLAEQLLPSFQGKGESVHTPFLRELGLLAFEEAETLSGVKATNMNLVFRRLLRVLERLGTRPCLAMTMCHNPSQASGVNEFASRLCQPFRLKTIERTDSRLVATHTYLLQETPDLLDSQGVDPLPDLAQLGLASLAWGAPTRVDAMETVRRHDKITPPWALDIARSNGFKGDPTESVLMRFNISVRSAWINMREVQVARALSLPELIASGGGAVSVPTVIESQTLEEVHLAVLQPHFAHRGIVGFLLQALVRADERGPGRTGSTRPLDAWIQLRRLGVRLINGEPSLGLQKKHILAALAEQPGSEEDILKLLPDDQGLRACLTALENEGQLGRRQSRRLLKVDGKPKLLTEEILEVSRMGRVSAPLDTMTPHDVALRQVGGETTLKSVDVEHARRVAYPGFVFACGDQRYRVSEKRYPEFLKRMERYRRARSDRERSAVGLWLACDLDDAVVSTTPVFERILHPPESGMLPDEDGLGRRSDRSSPVGIAFETLNSDGAPVRRWRARIRVQERFVARRSFHLENSWRYRSHRHDVIGPSPMLQWELPMEGLFLMMPGQVVSEAMGATLRRMLSEACHALMRVEEHLVAVHVTPRLGDLVPAHLDLSEADPAIVLLATYDGQAGLLEALGASPWPFFNNVLRLGLLWSRHLLSSVAEQGGGVRWEDIGYAGELIEDERLSPDVAGVLTLLERLLGEWVDEALAPIVPSPPVNPRREDAPKGLQQYAQYTPADGAVVALVKEVLGEIPASAEIHHICALYDWVWEHVVYRKDQDLYGVDEYPARPAELLGHDPPAGDCEDHVMLLASLFGAIGFRCRTVLVPGHASGELLLGSSDSVAPAKVEGEIKQWLEARCKEHGQPFGRLPYANGKKAGAGSYYPFEWTGIGTIVDEEGTWLVFDTAMAGAYPGDVAGLRDKGHWGATGWLSETRRAEPADRLEEQQPDETDSPAPDPPTTEPL